jgi:hypothetical protein
MKKILFPAIAVLFAAMYALSMTNAEYYAQFTKTENNITYVDLTKTSSKDIEQYKRTTPAYYLMVHQTDTRQELSYKSWLKIKAHMGATSDNKMLLLHGLDTKIKGTLGNIISLEVPGKYPCLIYPEFDKTHKDILTDVIKSNIRDAIDYFIIYSKARGLNVNQLYLIAHRQTFIMRGCDPGAEIYKFASRYAKSKGMVVDYEITIDSGSKIPTQWRN